MNNREVAYKHFMQEEMRIGKSYQDIFNAGYQAALASQPQQPPRMQFLDRSREKIITLLWQGICDGTVEAFDVNGMMVIPSEEGMTYVRKEDAISFFGLVEKSQAQQTESQWISVDEAKATLKDGDLLFAYCEFYGVVEATYAFEEGYYNPHRIVKKNGDSYRINTFTHFMARKPESLPPAPEGEKE